MQTLRNVDDVNNEQKAGPIKLGAIRFKHDAETTYLGITFDKRLTCKQHIAAHA